jgi:hypothetical protein
MTVEVQLLRAASNGMLIRVESISYPLAELELAKAKAKSLLEASDAKATMARVIDRNGKELFSCGVEDDLGWR